MELTGKTVIVVLVFFLPAAVLLYLGLVNRTVESRMAVWPTTPGETLQSEIRKVAIGRQGGLGRARTRGAAWKPYVRYAYEVNGNRLVSERFAPRTPGRVISGPDTAPGQELEAIVARYPVGSAVRVHYDPTEPATSYLEFRSQSAWRWLLVLSAAVGLIGFLVLLRARRVP